MAMTDEELRKLGADELLDLLIEECAEVIHATSKVKRFGPLRKWPGYNGGRCNADAVLREAMQVNDILRHYCSTLGVNYGDAIEQRQRELYPANERTAKRDLLAGQLFAERKPSRIAKLERLVLVMLDNDPNDDAADGVTVLDVWRREAAQLFASQKQ